MQRVSEGFWEGLRVRGEGDSSRFVREGLNVVGSPGRQ